MREKEIVRVHHKSGEDRKLKKGQNNKLFLVLTKGIFFLIHFQSKKSTLIIF